MKKTLALLFSVLLLFSVACAESVTRLEYRLSFKDAYIDGLYTGDMQDGVPQGFGVFEAESPDGTYCHYIGEWKDGLMSGQGSTYWSDGSIEIGQYEEGRFVSGSFNYNGLQLIKASKAGEETLNPFWISTVTYRRNDRDITQGVYIGNRNSKVFHRYDCDSVREMKEKNKVEFETKEEAEEAGYKPCSRCNP